MRPYTMRPPKKRRSPWPFVSIFSGLVLAGYTSAVLLWPLHAIEATVTPMPEITSTVTSLDWPDQGHAAIGTSSLGVLATNTEPATQVPIASITKVITALVILQAKPLEVGQAGPIITLTTEDAALYNNYVAQNGSVAAAPAGLQISQRQMLDAMLVSSANNYADSLSIWAYGSPDAYMSAARTWLKEQGLTNTSITDMTGFSPESKSTSGDLVKLGTLALKHPVIAEIVAQKSITIPGVGTLQNTNILLGSEGVNGIKTGTTDEAGSCLLFGVTQQVGDTTEQMIGVVLGAPNHASLFAQVRSLIASAKPNLQQVTISSVNQPVGTYQATWGASARAVAKESQASVVWSNQKITQRISLNAIRPADNTTSAGFILTNIAGKTLSTPVSLDRPLDGPSWHWRLTHPFDVF